jgi:hypothetical protein
MTKAICLGALLIATGSAGCGAQRAALNQASLRSGECGPNDTACRDRGMSAPLAVGATFRPNVDLNIPGAGGSVFHFVAAQPDIIEVRGHSLKAKAEGITAVIMSTGGTVVDFMHLSTKAVSEIRLDKLGADASMLGRVQGRVGLVEGEVLYLQPAAFGDGQRLAGRAEARWTASSGAVQILRDGSPHRRRLIATAPGSATVTVSLLGKQTTLRIDVVKGVER